MRLAPAPTQGPKGGILFRGEMGVKDFYNTLHRQANAFHFKCSVFCGAAKVSNCIHLQSAILQPLPGARLESFKVKKHIKVLHKAFTVSHTVWLRVGVVEASRNFLKGKEVN